MFVWTAVGLCLVVAVPGVVDQDDLDARWLNVLPALGVALALALTLAAVRREGASFVRHARGDRLRLVLVGLLLLLALPWFAAELGFYLPGDVFLGEEVPAKRDEGLAAVHLGFHHGTGGVLLSLTALLLSRAPRSALLAGQDAWNEQLWKREWVEWHAPAVLRPELSAGWLAIIVAAAAIYALWFRPPRER